MTREVRVRSGRLDSFAPDVAAALLADSPDLRVRAGRFAAEWAVATAGLRHPALAGGSSDRVAALVAELDVRYFGLSEARDAGQASDEDVVAAFGQARAADAVGATLRGEPADAIYEAAAAADDWSELRASVLSLLAGA